MSFSAFCRGTSNLTQDMGLDLEDAREAVRHHMRNNLCKTLCNERIRVQKIIDEKGGDFIDYKPAYLSDDVWDAFCEHWASPEFRRRSDAARAARRHQNNPHTSGAISFQGRAWDIRDKEGQDPARYDFIFVCTLRRTAMN